MSKSNESACLVSAKLIVPETKMIVMNSIDERVVFVVCTLRDDVHSQTNGKYIYLMRKQNVFHARDSRYDA